MLRRTKSTRLLLAGAAIVGLAFGGCDLNPRPEDPGSDPKSPGFGFGGDRGVGDNGMGGSATVSIPPKALDGGVDAGFPDAGDAQR
jgi:hypothetical protein